jgi:hypothetical protein
MKFEKQLQIGLQKSVPIAKTILNNCLFKPSKYNKRFTQIAFNILQIHEWVEKKPIERQLSYMKTFIGSSIYKNITTELDEINVVAQKDLSIHKLDAYKNIIKISINLNIIEK